MPIFHSEDETHNIDILSYLWSSGFLSLALRIDEEDHDVLIRLNGSNDAYTLPTIYLQVLKDTRGILIAMFHLHTKYAVLVRPRMMIGKVNITVLIKPKRGPHN